MTKLIIIAGPQSAGKTTLLNYLKSRYNNWYFIDEVNPASITGKKNFGIINTSADLQRKIIEADIENIIKIKRDHQFVLLESGIFHYAYARFFLYKKIAEEYFQKYLEAHKGLDPIVVFIHTNPSASWKRRKSKYLKRITDKGITDPDIKEQYLEKYREIIEKLYPYWLESYKKMPFPKMTIPNSNKSKNKFLKQAEQIIISLRK
jgi:deoxyadenosine/deoxycytidine kinase